MAFNTNGDLSSAYTGIPYKNVQPYNTNSGLNTTSTTVPSVGADFKELINAASYSQAGVKELIEDYKKKIADIDKNIAKLTAERAEIKAKDFSDEERRMIESYTTLGDLDAGVKQIMTSRQFKSALEQTKANETQANTEAANKKQITYANAVNAAAAFAVKYTDKDTGIMPESARDEYGPLMVTVHDTAKDIGKDTDAADKDVKAKMVEGRNAGAGGNVNPDGVNPVAAKVNDIIKKYNDLRNDVNLNEFAEADLKKDKPKEVQAAINDLSAKLSEINGLGISSEDKTKYKNLIDPVIKDLVVYRNAASEAAKAIGNASIRKGDIATAKAKAKEGIVPLKEWLTSGKPSANNVLNKLGLSAETVNGYGGAAMLDLISKVNALK